MLEKLYSETGLMDEVEFRAGVNIVLGRYAHDKQESGINGIGKSSLVRLVDYALLSDSAGRRFSQSNYGFLGDEDHTITLALRIRGDLHYIRRSFGKKRKIVAFGKDSDRLAEYSVQELRLVLLDLLFPIDDASVRYEGDRLRTLLNFFIKDDLDHRQRSDPMDFFPYRASTAEKCAYNFFLLGLPNSAQFRFIDDSKKYKDVQTHVGTLKESLQSETGKKVEEFKSQRAVSEQRVALLERSLRDYSFLDRYRDIEQRLSAITGQINERLGKYHILSRKLSRLQDLTSESPTIDVSEVQAMYSELSGAFAGLVARKLEEVISFKQAIVENRLRYNIEREQLIEDAIRQIADELSALEGQKGLLLRHLDEKGELDSITNTYEELISEKATLERSVQLLRQIDEGAGRLQEIELSMSEARVGMARDMKKAEGVLDDLRRLFREVIDSAVFLGEGQAGSAYFDVSVRPGARRNELPLKVEIEIPKSDALGRFQLRLVAYDLLVFLNAVRTQRQLPRFLVHDGAFHGISKRTTLDTLNFIHRQSLLYPGFQYIATFNEDELYVAEERKELDGVLGFDLGRATVAHYTDSRNGMIFKRAFS